MSKFKLGRVTASDAAVQFCKDTKLSMVTDIIFRHSLGEWGDVPPRLRELNDSAVLHGEGMIVSIYEYPLGKVRVVTESDRSATYVLMETEYLKSAN